MHAMKYIYTMQQLFELTLLYVYLHETPTVVIRITKIANVRYFVCSRRVMFDSRM